jgi:hypothetical protein
MRGGSETPVRGLKSKRRRQLPGSVSLKSLKISFTGCGKTQLLPGFVSGHDFSRAD